jgi:hypothetical protein
MRLMDESEVWKNATYLVAGGVGVRNGEGVGGVVGSGCRGDAHGEQSREGEEEVEKAHC